MGNGLADHRGDSVRKLIRRSRDSTRSPPLWASDSPALILWILLHRIFSCFPLLSQLDVVIADFGALLLVMLLLLVLLFFVVIFSFCCRLYFWLKLIRYYIYLFSSLYHNGEEGADERNGEKGVHLLDTPQTHYSDTLLGRQIYFVICHWWVLIWNWER